MIKSLSRDRLPQPILNTLNVIYSYLHFILTWSFAKSIAKQSTKRLCRRHVDCVLYFNVFSRLTGSIIVRHKIRKSETVHMLQEFKHEPAEFLKWSNPPSIFGTVHYHFRDIEMRTWSWSDTIIEPGQTARMWQRLVTFVSSCISVNYVNCLL